MVVNSLTEIVAMTTDPVDQNTDNIQIISTIIFDMASLLGKASVMQKLEPEIIQMVSCIEHSKSSFQL